MKLPPNLLRPRKRYESTSYRSLLGNSASPKAGENTLALLSRLHRLFNFHRVDADAHFAGHRLAIDHFESDADFPGAICTRNRDDWRGV